MSCNISGVPRMIHTNVRTNQRRGRKRLMDPKAITNPKGSENISVNAKSLQFRKKLSVNRLTITGNTFISISPQYTM